MKKFLFAIVCISVLMLLLPLMVYGSDIDSGAKILRVEYQGVELSTDKQNPTYLEWTGNDIYIDLIGNSACASLEDYDIRPFINEGLNPCPYSTGLFDSSGIASWPINFPREIYVYNDVFEVYWTLTCLVEKTDDHTKSYGTILDSDSPKYYITFNLGNSDYNPPQGDVPTIVRVELNDVELSKDKNNPTNIPHFNRIKLLGNTACSSKIISVQRWCEGMWTRGGAVELFTSSAISSSSIFAPYDDNENPRYDETIEIAFAFHDEIDYETAISMSPTYYVSFVDEDYKFGNIMVNGVFHTIKLNEDTLIIEAKQGFTFVESDMILKDKTESIEYTIGIWSDNPNCSGINTNRIEYSNLPLKMDHLYELVIPVGVACSEISATQDKTSYVKHNGNYSTELIMEGAVTFSDIKDDDWEQPYVNELTEKRVLNGYEDGTFRPNAFVTRSEFAKMMYLALQLDKTYDYSGVIVDQPFFVDVLTENWDYMYVKYVGKYMTGFKGPDGNVYFRGDEDAVREDMAVALVKAMGLDNEDVDLNELTSIFSDYETISPNVRKYVLIAYKQNLINGYPDGTFGAQKSITRAETAALLIKVMKSDAMEKVVF